MNRHKTAYVISSVAVAIPWYAADKQKLANTRNLKPCGKHKKNWTKISTRRVCLSSTLLFNDRINAEDFEKEIHHL